MADVKTLELLVHRMRADVARGGGLSYAAVMSITCIIEDAIGAPVGWPSRIAGCEAAAKYYPGANDLRHGFNAGVKWAVERYQLDNYDAVKWRDGKPTPVPVPSSERE